MKRDFLFRFLYARFFNFIKYEWHLFSNFISKCPPYCRMDWRSQFGFKLPGSIIYFFIHSFYSIVAGGLSRESLHATDRLFADRWTNCSCFTVLYDVYMYWLWIRVC